MEIMINEHTFTVTKMKLVSIYDNDIGIIIDGKTYRYYDTSDDTPIFYKVLYESGVFDEEETEICRILSISDINILDGIEIYDDIIDNYKTALKSLHCIANDYNLRSISIKKLIGHGKNSFIYLLSEEQEDGSKKDVVLKVNDNFDINKKECKAIINEIEILKLLDGFKFAMQLIRYVKYNDTIFTFIEHFNDSETLHDYIYQNHGDDQTTAKIISNLIAGLLNLHEKEILHRDIKPNNILVNPKTGDIQYIDFDMSVTFQNFKSSSVKMGTPKYRDPCLIMNKNANLSNYLKADLWCLGITILEMCIKKIFYLYTKVFLNFLKVSLKRKKVSVLILIE